MTTVASTSSGSTSPPPRGPRSPLEEAIVKQPELIGLLTSTARGRTHNLEDAKEVVSAVFARACQRERKGQGWSPKGKFTIRGYLFSMLHEELNNWRRSKLRNRAILSGDASELADAAREPWIESEDEENDRLDALEEALRAFFADETDGHIPIGIMDLRIQGIREHGRIAEILKCSPDDVKRGYDRLVHHAKRLAGIVKKGRPS